MKLNFKQILIEGVAPIMATEVLVWAFFVADAKRAVAKIGGRDVFNAWAPIVIKERMAEGRCHVCPVVHLRKKWYDCILMSRSDLADIVMTCKDIQTRIGVAAAAIWPEPEEAKEA